MKTLIILQFDNEFIEVLLAKVIICNVKNAG